jgi:hypothetical protein
VAQPDTTTGTAKEPVGSAKRYFWLYAAAMRDTMKRRRRNPGSAADLLIIAGLGVGGYLAAKAGTLGPDAQHFVSGLTGSGNVPVVTPGSGAKGTYTTINGIKTVDQMHAELDKAAGGKWSGDGASPNDPANIAKGYAKATGGAVTAN